MNIVRWQPFPELMSLRQAMDRLVGDNFISNVRPLGIFGGDMATLIDMYQTDTDVVVKTALPGVKPEEIDVTITDNTLAIKGKTKTEEEIKAKDYFYKERRYGTFNRLVSLPHGLNTDKVKTNFEDGILTLTLPKSKQIKPNRIKVKTRSTNKDKK